MPNISSILELRTPLVVPDDYVSNFRKAFCAFKYQVVFDPVKKAQVRLHEPSDDVTPAELQWAGSIESDASTALQYALGNLDPSSGRVVNGFDPYQLNSNGGRRGQPVHREGSVWCRKNSSEESLKVWAMRRARYKRDNAQRPLPEGEQDSESEAPDENGFGKAMETADKRAYFAIGNKERPNFTPEEQKLRSLTEMQAQQQQDDKVASEFKTSAGKVLFVSKRKLLHAEDSMSRIPEEDEAVGPSAKIARLSSESNKRSMDGA